MQRGQALIVVLLILGVALTVGLAVVSRSVIEVNLSSIQDEGARALSAAEAGIEQTLGGIITGPSGSGTVGSVGDQFVVQKSSVAGATVYLVAEELVAGDTATVALDSNFNSAATNNLRICFGKSGSQPAVQLMGYYRPTAGGAAIVNTLAYDSDALRGNGFGAATSGDPGCPNFAFGALLTNTRNLIPNGNTPLYLRVRVLYNPPASPPVPLGFVAEGSPSWSFPAQGEQIIAVGQAGETTQKISVFKGTPDWFPMWDDAVFSGVGLIQ